jgi:hypothetical protein
MLLVPHDGSLDQLLNGVLQQANYISLQYTGNDNPEECVEYRPRTYSRLMFVVKLAYHIVTASSTMSIAYTVQNVIETTTTG